MVATKGTNISPSISLGNCAALDYSYTAVTVMQCYFTLNILLLGLLGISKELQGL